MCTNALSRHADGICVCDDCGTAEAMLDFMRNPLPLECWAQFREGEASADFKAVPGEEALKTIPCTDFLCIYFFILVSCEKRNIIEFEVTNHLASYFGNP